MNLIPPITGSANPAIVLLAPSLSSVPDRFDSVQLNPQRHEALLAQMQRLRGAVYLKDGAIGPNQLDDDSRHRLPVDDRSWHVLTLDGGGNVNGCSRYCAHPTGVKFQQLDMVASALARDSKWSEPLRIAVEEDIALAKGLGMSFVEAGGWALSEAARGSTAALRIALATYSLAEVLGGCIGMTTATVRHCSASILRRIGGHSLKLGGQTFPTYFDPQYECEMEILRFDSRSPNPQFRHWVRGLGSALTQVPIVCARPGWQMRALPQELAMHASA
jgi:hypothetical protein